MNHEPNTPNSLGERGYSQHEPSPVDLEENLPQNVGQSKQAEQSKKYGFNWESK